MLFLEPYWQDRHKRKTYAEQICKLKSEYFRKNNSSIIIYNKIDLTPLVISFGKVHEKAVEQEIKQTYPGVLEIFKNQNLLTSCEKNTHVEYYHFRQESIITQVTEISFFSPGPVESVIRLWKQLEKRI